MSTSLLRTGLLCTIFLSAFVGMTQKMLAADDAATPITLTQGKILREVWSNVPGAKLSDADFNARYDTAEYLDSFDAPQFYAENFASRMTAFVTVPTTGVYTFYVASDDQSELQVSLTGSLSDLAPIASVDLYTKYLAWTRFPSQTSAPLALTAGQRILVRMLHKDGSQRDHASVGWSVDGGEIEIIPGSVCQAPSTTEPLLPPTSLAALAASDQQVTLDWAAPEMFHIKGYKVYRDGVDISGELATLGFVDKTITPETAYTYTVTALNYEDQESVVSNAVDVITMAVPPVGIGTGLTGFYYDTEYLTDRKLIRTDASIDFDWSGSPAPGVDANSFSVKWMGLVQPRYSGLWTLHTRSTDGVRLVVDGKMVIDDWKRHGLKWNGGTIYLEAGRKYPICLEYFDHYGSASIQLHWSSLCQPKQIIPQEQLYLEPYVTGSGIKIITAEESLTSPAFVEAKVGLGATSLTVTGTDASLTRYKPLYAYTNIPLNADGTPTDITLATETDQATQALVWKPTVLNGLNFSEDEIIIRQGDSLLLTALDLKTPGKGKANGLVRIDADGDGVMDFHCAPGQGQPFKYSNPGSYQVNATVRGQDVGSLTVRVIGVDFGGNTVCQVGFNRTKEVTITGGTLNDVRILSFDPSDLRLSSVEPTESGAKFMLKPMPNGTPSYFVRLNDGPVIASQTVNTFDLRSLNPKFIGVVETFEDGSKLLEGKLAMTPCIPDLTVEVNMITGGITFDDSTQFKVFSTNDFIVDEKTGERVLTCRFIRPPGHGNGPCHVATVVQGGATVGRTQEINPKVLEVDAIEYNGTEYKDGDTIYVPVETAVADREMMLTAKEANDIGFDNGRLIEWTAATEVADSDSATFNRSTVSPASSGTSVTAAFESSSVTVAIVVIDVVIDAYIYGEDDRKIAGVDDLTECNVVASGYVKYEATLSPSGLDDVFSYAWSASAGTLGADTDDLDVDWDAPDTHETDSDIEITLEYSGVDVGSWDCTVTSIRPYVVRVKFVDDRFNEEQQIDDNPANSGPEFNAIAGVNSPVCYVRNRGMQVEVDLAGDSNSDASNHLTKKTEIRVEAVATYGSGIENEFSPDSSDSDVIDDNTEDWSAEDYSTLILESDDNLPKTVEAFPDFAMHWTFKVMNSSGDWVAAYQDDGQHSQATQHRESVNGRNVGLCVSFDVEKMHATAFKKNELGYACEYAQGHSQIEDVLTSLLSDGFDSHYTYALNCNRLASTYVRMCRHLGIDAVQRFWGASHMHPNYYHQDTSYSWRVGDMNFMMTRQIDPVGLAPQTYVWPFHQWAEANNKTRDPSAAYTHDGDWRSYEDFVFTHYGRVTAVNPVPATPTTPARNVVGTVALDANQAGQGLGCESRAIAGPGLFHAFVNPDR